MIEEFKPGKTSPTIDAGTDVGLKRDAEGNLIINIPDIGVIEFLEDLMATKAEIIAKIDGLIFTANEIKVAVQALPEVAPVLDAIDIKVNELQQVVTSFRG